MVIYHGRIRIKSPQKTIPSIQNPDLPFLRKKNVPFHQKKLPKRQKLLLYGNPTFNRNPYNGCINPYYWVDDHLLLYGNNGS